MVNDYLPIMDDENLLHEVLSGADPKTRKRFVLEHWNWSVRRAMARGAPEPEDIVQDVFLDILDNPRRVSKDVKVRAVLSVMISDRIIELHRAKKRMPIRELYADLLRGHTDLSSLARRERLTLEVLDAMKRLQTMHRAMLEMRYFDGLRPAEIARQMSLTDAAVRGLLFRGLGSLREELGLAGR